VTILAAQAESFRQITEVRLEMATEAKDMRRELVDTFNRAHDENKERLAEIARNLNDSVKENQLHAADDNRRFEALNRAVYMALGGLGLLTVSLQVWNALK
jgi:hypothetical protein